MRMKAHYHALFGGYNNRFSTAYVRERLLIETLGLIGVDLNRSVILQLQLSESYYLMRNTKG